MKKIEEVGNMTGKNKLNVLDEELAFKIKVDNKEVLCYAILIFDNPDTGKKYIVYTDGTKTNDGTLEILASVYNIVNNEIVLDDITTDAEWDMVDEMLLKLGGSDE